MKRHAPTLLVTLLLCGAVSAFAQGGGPVSLKLSMLAVKTIKIDGKPTEQLLPNPGSVNPGDVISQVISVKNATAKAIRDLPVQLPVPKNTVYLAPEKGLDGTRTMYSIDGGKTFAAAPLKKTITVTENGKSVQKEVEVRPSEYNAVRWTVAELGPGQTLELGYRIQVK
ncbi:hypothetical protein [Deinococcus marmoris]|uniref:DUF11 domain-containing protein n=1 Tax=Deinococcus marmoris TaxID=249408 RepID=A0A1U7P1H0_9DEIO|nr:hypothetical protein [Deinococcus marmoris]OLV19009.1 hypothetical protein BOO71_0004051 [Deinococcus marmoris]